MTSFNQLIEESNVDKLRTGDVLLVESKGSWFDRVIKFFGRSQFTHTAMLVDIKGSWFVVESRPRHQQNEYQMMPADWWVERNKCKETYIGKMPILETTKDIEDKIRTCVMNPKWSTRPYKISWCAMVVILQDLFGIKRPSIKKYRDESEHPMICSTIVQETWENAGVIDKGNFKSPGNIAELSGGLNSLIPLFFDSSQKASDSNYLPNNYKVESISAV